MPPSACTRVGAQAWRLWPKSPSPGPVWSLWRHAGIQSTYTTPAQEDQARGLLAAQVEWEAPAAASRAVAATGPQVMGAAVEVVASEVEEARSVCAVLGAAAGICAVLGAAAGISWAGEVAAEHCR